MSGDVEAMVERLTEVREYHCMMYRQYDTVTEAAAMLRAQQAETERLREALERIAFGMSIELDDEDGPVQVWLDADELSEIARAALAGGTNDG